jgi:hypothetical protein
LIFGLKPSLIGMGLLLFSLSLSLLLCNFYY